MNTTSPIFSNIFAELAETRSASHLGVRGIKSELASLFTPEGTCRMNLPATEEEAVWCSLCKQAWIEQDPVRLLEITMKIAKFLAQKQRRLDIAFDMKEQGRA